MSSTLKVTREVFGIELRRGTFDISVDNNSVGSIDSHGAVELPIEPGHHTLRLRAGRYSSREHSFDVADDAVVNFLCHGARIWPTYVASIFKPDLAISLRQQ
jgi:hypothetical protein